MAEIDNMDGKEKLPIPKEKPAPEETPEAKAIWAQVVALIERLRARLEENKTT